MALKVERGCADCGYNAHACALDFDHRPGETKIGSIAAMRKAPRRLLLAEVAKCDVVCANCHRIRHEARHIAAPRPFERPGVKKKPMKDSKFCSRLNEPAVEEMLLRYLSGDASIETLIEDYAVTRYSVLQVLRGSRWKNVRPDIRGAVRAKSIGEKWTDAEKPSR